MLSVGKSVAVGLALAAASAEGVGLHSQASARTSLRAVSRAVLSGTEYSFLEMVAKKYECRTSVDDLVNHLLEITAVTQEKRTQIETQCREAKTAIQNELDDAEEQYKAAKLAAEAAEQLGELRVKQEDLSLELKGHMLAPFAAAVQGAATTAENARHALQHATAPWLNAVAAKKQADKNLQEQSLKIQDQLLADKNTADLEHSTKKAGAYNTMAAVTGCVEGSPYACNLSSEGTAEKSFTNSKLDCEAAYTEREQVKDADAAAIKEIEDDLAELGACANAEQPAAGDAEFVELDESTRLGCALTRAKLRRAKQKSRARRASASPSLLETKSLGDSEYHVSPGFALMFLESDEAAPQGAELSIEGSVGTWRDSLTNEMEMAAEDKLKCIDSARKIADSAKKTAREAFDGALKRFEDEAAQKELNLEAVAEGHINALRLAQETAATALSPLADAYNTAVANRVAAEAGHDEVTRDQQTQEQKYEQEHQDRLTAIGADFDTKKAAAKAAVEASWGQAQESLGLKETERANKCEAETQICDHEILLVQRIRAKVKDSRIQELAMSYAGLAAEKKEEVRWSGLFDTCAHQIALPFCPSSACRNTKLTHARHHTSHTHARHSHNGTGGEESASGTRSRA